MDINPKLPVIKGAEIFQITLKSNRSSLLSWNKSNLGLDRSLDLSSFLKLEVECLFGCLLSVQCHPELHWSQKQLDQEWETIEATSIPKIAPFRTQQPVRALHFDKIEKLMKEVVFHLIQFFSM